MADKTVRLHNKSDKPDNVVERENDVLDRCEAIEAQLPSWLRGFFMYLKTGVLPMTRLSYLSDVKFFFSYLINETELKELLKKAIYNISHNTKQAGHSDSAGYSLPVRLACEYIEKNFQENINLNKISNYVSLSKNYFCNIFKKEVGVTIWDYLIRIRMEEARRMLLETDLKTYDISGKIGYDDPSYFGRLFKKYTGFTPTEYRESSRKEK